MSDSDSWSIVSGNASNDERDISYDEGFTKVGRDENQYQRSPAPREVAQESAAQFQYPPSLTSSRQPTAAQPDPDQVHKHFRVPTMPTEKSIFATVPQLAKVATLAHVPSNSLITIGRNLEDQVAGSLGGLGIHVGSRQNSPIPRSDHSDNESLKDDQERLQKHKENAERGRARASRTSIRTSTQVSETQDLIPSLSTNKRKVLSNPYDLTPPTSSWKRSPPHLNVNSRRQREFVQNYRGRTCREERIRFEMSRGTENEMRRDSIDRNLPIQTKQRNMINPAPFDNSMGMGSATQVHNRSMRPGMNFDPPRAPPSPPLSMQTSMHDPPAYIHGAPGQVFSFGPAPPTQPRNSSLFNEQVPITSGAPAGQIFSFGPVSSQPTQPRQYWSLVDGVCTTVPDPASEMLENNTGARTCQ